MLRWKNPPKAKVYEALTAVLDGRVRDLGEGEAEVTSSGGDKIYKVGWTEGTKLISSNDNASFYQGYLGYPIIAVLLETGSIPFDRSVAKPLANVPWKAVNDRFKRNYDAAVDHVLSEAHLSPDDRSRLDAMVERIYGDVVAMDLGKLPGQGPRPPR